MRFAVYVEVVHESGPRCGVDAVADFLCRDLGDLQFEVRQGNQTEPSVYMVDGASPRRWAR